MIFGGRHRNIEGAANVAIRHSSKCLKRQAAHRGRGIECLRHRYECNIVPIKDFDQLGKIHEEARQAVALVDDYDINQTRLNILNQGF